MGAVCSFMWERTRGTLPKPFKMPSSRILVCVCQTKLWETDSTKAKHPLVRPVRTSPALRRNWFSTKLEGLPLASNRVSKWDKLPAEDAIKRERIWSPSYQSKTMKWFPTGKCIQLSSLSLKIKRCVKWPQVGKAIWLKILVCASIL